jgi:hypothetical protein
MRDDERSRRNDPAYKRMCFVVAEGTRLGYADDEPIFYVDDRRDANSTFTLRDCRMMVARWTKEIWVQDEYERILDELGPWAEEVEPDRNELARQYDEQLARGLVSERFD